MTPADRPALLPVRRLLLGLVTVVLVLAGCAGGGDEDAPDAEAAPVEVRGDERPDADGHRGVSDVPELVREVGPSVVAVLAGGGAGSGVVWDEEGLIVTNHHVAAQGSDLRVVLADGSELRAELVAGDERSDLAVLRVDRLGLPAATFATELPDVGELAIAVGNPLGFESSVSQGIISGVQRTLPVPGPAGQALVDLIQTDAAMSPGNSGGALVDGAGRVVGISVAFIPPQAGAVALGFAIPSATVVDVVEQLLERGEVRHGFLGVSVGPVTQQLAERFDLGTDSGVVVLDVVEGGPAAEAGVRSGDVIVGLAGEEIRSIRDFLSALHRLDVGAQADLEVLRRGDRVELQVTIGERPASE